MPHFPIRLTGDFKSAIVIDAETGMVLVATKRHPAPTGVHAEDDDRAHRPGTIAEGDVKMDDKVKVSAKSSKMGGSQVYLKHGEVFTVEELLQALAIHSANDAAVALAEHVAGSTDAFIDLMNMRAEDLGMTNTEFQYRPRLAARLETGSRT